MFNRSSEDKNVLSLLLLLLFYFILGARNSSPFCLRDYEGAQTADRNKIFLFVIKPFIETKTEQNEAFWNYDGYFVW